MAKDKETDGEEVSTLSIGECKVAMTKRVYNDLIQANEELTLEICGDSLDKCLEVFNQVAEEHGFEMVKKWQKEKN